MIASAKASAVSFSKRRVDDSSDHSNIAYADHLSVIVSLYTYYTIYKTNKPSLFILFFKV